MKKKNLKWINLMSSPQDFDLNNAIKQQLILKRRDNLAPMNKILILCLVFITAITLACSSGIQGTTTVYIVRHAEKDVTNPKNQDPDLNSDGMKRAEALASKLKSKKIAAAFATNFKRTIQTASSVAKNNNIEIQIYDAHDFNSIVKLIKSKYHNQNVLLVGHSNTVLELLEAFGAKRPLSSLNDQDYDFLFELTIDSNGKTLLITEHYGQSHHSSSLTKNSIKN